MLGSYILKLVIKLAYYFIKALFYVIKKIFNRYKHKLSKYPPVCRFLAVFDVFIKYDRKKNYMLESHLLPLDMWFAWHLRDGPIILLLWLIFGPRLLLRYIIFVFSYDMYMAFCIILSYRLYWYNMLLLIPCVLGFFFVSSDDQYLNIYWDYTWDIRGYLWISKMYKYFSFISKITNRVNLKFKVYGNFIQNFIK